MSQVWLFRALICGKIVLRMFDAEHNGIAFIGTADPWSNLEDVKQMAQKRKVLLHLYEGVNHSLEENDQIKNIEILENVMLYTKDYFRDYPNAE